MQTPQFQSQYQNKFDQQRSTNCPNDVALAQQMQKEFDMEDQKYLEEKKNAIASNNDYFDVLKSHRDSVEEFLTTNFVGVGTVKEITPNPYAQPGQPLYNRFVTQWERVADQTVELCFHGTAEANIDAICQSGLDPKRRSGQAYGPGKHDRLGCLGRRGCRGCLGCLGCLGGWRVGVVWVV